MATDAKDHLSALIRTIRGQNLGFPAPGPFHPPFWLYEFRLSASTFRFPHSAFRNPKKVITDATDGHGCERSFIRVNPPNPWSSSAIRTWMIPHLDASGSLPLHSTFCLLHFPPAAPAKPNFSQ